MKMFRRGFSYIFLFGIITGVVFFAYNLIFYQDVKRFVVPMKIVDDGKLNTSSTFHLDNDSDNQSYLKSKLHFETNASAAITSSGTHHLSSSVLNSSLDTPVTITAPYKSISATSGILTTTLFPHLTVAKWTTPTNTLYVNVSVTTTLSTTMTLTLNDNGTRVICHSFMGRLGNILFQYASVLGLSYSLNRTAIFRNTQYLDQVLKNSTNHPTRHKELNARCNGAPGIGESSCCKFDPRLYGINPKQDYWVRGYLQSYKYFDQHQDRIKAAITFNEIIVQNASKIISRLRQRYENCMLIGVHARLGDFLSERNKKLGYPIAPSDFYNRSFTYFTNKFPNCVFVVSSENNDWCKANLPGGFNVTYLESNSAALDMAILSSLDHIVTTFGTFSWWSGYLNSGITVYMKDFIKPNTFIGNQFLPNGTGYIFPGWVPL